MSTKLICYLSLGYPTLEESIEIAKVYVESGCDMIEIGWPTDNGFLDSEFIASKMKAALEKCSDSKLYYEAIRKIRRDNPSTPLLLLIYEHTLESLGTSKVIEFCRDNSIEGIILVGTKDNTIKNQLMENGLKVSCYVPFDLPEEQVKEAADSNGFVYLQAKPSGKVREGCDTLQSCIKYLRDSGITAPIYCGVGIYTPEDVSMASLAGADGVFIGSSIIKKYDDLNGLRQFIKDLKTGGSL